MAPPAMLIPLAGTWAAELSGRTALTGDVHWKIEIDHDDDGAYTDYTDELRNNQVKIEAKGGIFKASEATSATFVLRNSPKIFSEGQCANMPAKISVSIGASTVLVILTGYVSERGCQRSKRHLVEDQVTITVYDPAHFRGMARKCALNVYASYKVCDTANTGTSLAHALASMMGLSIPGDLEFMDLNYTKDYLPLNDSLTAWQELQDLAIAYGAFLGFRYDGDLRLIVWTAAEWAAASPEYTFDSTNVHSWSGVGGDKFCNRARLEYSEYQALPAGSVIYKNYDDFDDETEMNAIEVAAGEYWPGGTDAAAVGRLHYAYKDEEYPIGKDIVTPTFGLTGSGSDIEGDGTLTLISFNGSTTATRQNTDSSEIIFQNATGSTITITKFQVRGTPIRESATNEIYNQDAAISDEWDVIEREIPGKYCATAAAGQSICKRWVDFGKAARKEISAVVDFTPHLQIGAVVHFHPSSDVELDCLVIGYTHQSKGPHSRTRTTVQLQELIDFSAVGTGIVTHKNVGNGKTEAAVATAAAIANTPTYEQVNTVTVPSGLVIPVYIYPTGGGVEANWAEVILQARTFPDVQCSVIVNPSTGPGAAVDANYTDAIAKCHGAGIKCLGYIATDYPYSQKLTMQAGGYVNCVAGDLGKAVVSGTKTGTLRTYDNATRIWTISITGTKFAATNACTITSGTGQGTISAIDYWDKTLQNILDEVQLWLYLYPAIDGIFLDEVTYEAALTDYVADFYKAIYGFSRLRKLYPIVGNPGVAVPDEYFDYKLFDVCVIYEGDTWPAESAISLYSYNLDYDRKKRAILVYDETWSTASYKMCMKYVGSVYCNDQTGPWDSIPTHLEEQFRLANNRTTQLAFEADDGTDDDRLPDDCPLLDCQTPELSWHGSEDITLPQLLAGKMTTFVPPKIGATANPECFWAGRGAIKVEKATTNYVEHGACTDASNVPHVTGETAHAVANCTFAYTEERLAIDGFACYKMTKTSAAGAGWATVYVDAGSTADMSCFAAGDDAVISAEILVPSTGGPSANHVFVETGTYYSSAWHQTSGTVNTQDVWKRVEAARVDLDTATGVQQVLVINTAADVNTFIYIRNIKVEKSPYATSFTPSTRPAGQCGFRYACPDAGEMTLTLHPGFNYDTGTDRRFILWGDTSGTRFELYYNDTIDKIGFRIYDGGSNVRANYSAALNAASLNIDMQIRIKWSLADDLVTLWINGVEQTTGFVAAGSIASLSFPSTMYLGHDPATGSGSEADSVFADIALNPSSTALFAGHYAVGRPYYDPHEVMNANRGWRVNLTDNRLHNVKLHNTDDAGRESILDAEGLRVKDAVGNTLFQTPDAILQEDSYPMGQLYIHKYDNATYTLVNTTSFTNDTWVTNVAIVTDGISNIRGVRLKVYVDSDDSGAASANVWLRPYGSSWGMLATDMTPGIKVGGTISYNGLKGVLDCPVGSGAFDWAAYLEPSGTRTVIIQQIGIWV